MYLSASIFSDDKCLRKQVMRIVTDSKCPKDFNNPAHLSLFYFEFIGFGINLMIGSFGMAAWMTYKTKKLFLLH